ncbi:MAG: RlpA-like double-psi beta-barrel domain-containing protein [bacterium]|nr:RlpA-like double-psi beta-barrel domain-containing protein [bacterium]
MLLIILGLLFYKLFFKNNSVYSGDFTSENKKITIFDDAVRYDYFGVKIETVGEFLEERKINLRDADYIFPSKESKIYSESKIIIERNKNISVTVDGKKINGKTLGRDVAAALWDNDVKLRDDDFTNPPIENPIEDKSNVEVIRVDIREEKVKKDVDFEKISTEDDKLGWRIKKIGQMGVKGADEYAYKVVSHNGKEISRKLLSKIRALDPTPEISVQGTYMKLGKKNTGFGTWYAWKGGLFAASPWLPMGSYAKVTNESSGESVVVQINDRGPFGKNRIIDLDKVAFAKIAGIGAGVINVTVEQVLN